MHGNYAGRLYSGGGYVISKIAANGNFYAAYRGEPYWEINSRKREVNFYVPIVMLANFTLPYFNHPQ